jgi:hypothetical protein
MCSSQMLVSTDALGRRVMAAVNDATTCYTSWQLVGPTGTRQTALCKILQRRSGANLISRVTLVH